MGETSDLDWYRISEPSTAWIHPFSSCFNKPTQGSWCTAPLLLSTSHGFFGTSGTELISLQKKTKKNVQPFLSVPVHHLPKSHHCWVLKSYSWTKIRLTSWIVININKYDTNRCPDLRCFGSHTWKESVLGRLYYLHIPNYSNSNWLMVRETKSECQSQALMVWQFCSLPSNSCSTSSACRGSALNQVTSGSAGTLPQVL